MIDQDSKLSADLLVQLRQRLRTELDSIQMELETLQQRASVVTLDQTSVGRLSRMDAMQDQAMASGMRERILVRRSRTKAALDRLGAGTYGKCCECDLALSLERLNADPAAPFCADCQGEIDERRKSR
jgi:DnaK suppressor protein